MARVANEENETQQQNQANALINYYLNYDDSLAGDSLALAYLQERAADNIFAQEILSNIASRSETLAAIRTENDPARRVYMDINNVANLKHDPLAFIAQPDRIELLNSSLQSAGNLQTDSPESFMLIKPNPNSGIFEIKISDNSMEESAYELKVIDKLGKIVYITKVYAKENLTLNLQHYPTGIYHVIAINNKGNISHSSVSIIH